ncbi:MAG: ATP-grasp domain-containing protein [Candidatus Bathyarchaeia archaeon]
MKFLVYEYLFGGGCIGQSFQADFLCEGYAMLHALIEDFKALGHFVMTILDSRVAELNPPLRADRIIPVSDKKNLNKLLNEACKNVDVAYIIAPELNGMLKELVKKVEEIGAKTMNCSFKAIEETSNKINVYERLKRVGIDVPETMSISVHEDIKHVKKISREIGFPLIFKPPISAGSCGLSLVKNEEQIEGAIRKIKESCSEDTFLVQEFIRGSPASISLICDGERVLPLTLNAQLIKLAPPEASSSYEGGIVPYDHPLSGEAMRVAEKTIKCFTGLRGYVGVDMVLAENGPFVIEINPRLTTPYIGARKVLNFNVADALLQSVFTRKLPEEVRTLGYVFFFKVRLKCLKGEDLCGAYVFEDIFFPPLPTASGGSCALILSFSKDLRSAMLKAYKYKESLTEAFGACDEVD